MLKELIFPILNTTIGAFIGGMFAYIIAKNRIVFDYINFGKTTISFFKLVSESIVNECNSIIKHIQKIDAASNNPEKIKELLIVLFNKNEDLCDKFITFVSYWERYKEKLFCCTMSHICKNKTIRSKYKEIYVKIDDTQELIQNYQLIFKEYYTEYKKNFKDSNVDIDKFYNNVILSKMKENLGTIKKNSEQIIELCSQLNKFN